MNYSSKSITAAHQNQRAPHPFAAKPPSHSPWLFTLLPSAILGGLVWHNILLLCSAFVTSKLPSDLPAQCWYHMFSSSHNPRVGIPPGWESLPLSSKEWIKGNKNNHWIKYFPEFPQKTSLRFPWGSSTRNKPHGHPWINNWQRGL